MGWASEMEIEIHNELLETDEDYRAAYEESVMLDWALEEEYFRRLAEEEKQMDWFDDLRLAHDGYEERDEAGEISDLIDTDIPF
jgi:hypothetical protein